MAFTSTKGSGQSWNPKVNADGSPKMEALETDYLDGYYASRRDGVGQYNSTVVTIQKDNDERVDVFCDTVLGGEMDKVRLGQYVRIQYKGKKLKKAALNKAPGALRDTDYFNDWEVFVDTDVAPLGGAVGGTQHKPESNAGNPSNNIQVVSLDGDDLPF
jgi:hypothetical protein